MLRLFIVLALTAPARAELVASPYLHANAGDVEIRRGGFGAYAGYLGPRFGLELDVDRHHHFYKDARLTSVPNNCVPGVIGRCIDANTDAWLVTANALARLPTWSPRWQPHASLGAGLIRAWIHGAGEFDSEQLHAAAHLGAGLTFRVNGWLGIRADLRYIHAFVDEGDPDGGYASDYDFARLSLGVAFRM